VRRTAERAPARLPRTGPPPPIAGVTRSGVCACCMSVGKAGAVETQLQRVQTSETANVVGDHPRGQSVY